jgi:hypothetical protein
MALQKLQFKPGIVRDTTDYTNEGGWRDGDKIRFRLGFPESIGGWSKLTSTTLLGSCRSMHVWASLTGTNYIRRRDKLKTIHSRWHRPNRYNTNQSGYMLQGTLHLPPLMVRPQ